MTADYPDFCLRGLKKKGFLWNNGEVHTEAFMPDKRTAETRRDGGSEVSINWEDDDTVLDFTLRDLSISPHGVARLGRKDIDHINSFPVSEFAPLSYERARLPDNDYHGNLVFRNDLSALTIKAVATMLAFASKGLPRPG